MYGVHAFGGHQFIGDSVYTHNQLFHIIIYSEFGDLALYYNDCMYLINIKKYRKTY